jgi:hypothetical protein
MIGFQPGVLILSSSLVSRAPTVVSGWDVIANGRFMLMNYGMLAAECDFWSR